jgi:hypothetical protein
MASIISLSFSKKRCKGEEDGAGGGAFVPPDCQGTIKEGMTTSEGDSQTRI